MTILIIILSVAAAVLAVLTASYLLYRRVFSVPRRRPGDALILPQGSQYEQSREVMVSLIEGALSRKYERVSITSRDGLTLCAKYYHIADGAPVEILMHGYRGFAERDFCGGLRLCVESGHNALLVDQRAHGDSGGRCLSFGILERYDCLDWIGFITGRFGEHTEIILTGVSMGAATVLSATDLPLPENVVAVIADSGYTSPRDIIRKVLADMSCPVWAVYPFIRLGARIFGGFDLEESGAVTSLASCRIPVLLIHGEDDRFVPCRMSRENYAACASEKTLLTVPGAGHGLSYIVDREAYERAVRGFLSSVLGG